MTSMIVQHPRRTIRTWTVRNYFSSTTVKVLPDWLDFILDPALVLFAYSCTMERFCCFRIGHFIVDHCTAKSAMLPSSSESSLICFERHNYAWNIAADIMMLEV